jgi:hypothetical protein
MLEMLAELHGREGGRKKNPAAAVLNVRRTTGDELRWWQGQGGAREDPRRWWEKVLPKSPQKGE